MLAFRNIVGRALPLLNKLPKPSPLLITTPNYSFAFMQLFQKNKTPAELDPIFRRPTKLKGHVKSKARKQYSKKLNTRAREPKQKLRNHKGLLSRIKIVRNG